MEIFNRDETMSKILDFLDIPRFLFPYDTYKCIGPNNPDYFHNYNEGRKKQEETVIATLEALSDEELLELNEGPMQSHWFSRKHFFYDPPPWYAGGFGVKIHMADFAYWAKMDFWTLEEATCLSIGFKPESMPKKAKQMSPYEAINYYHKRLELFERAKFGGGKLKNRITPHEFMAWVQKKEIEIPEEIMQLLSAKNQTEATDPREKTSLLNLIAIMAKDGYRYDSSKRSNVPTEIYEAAKKNKIKISKETIRNHLKTAVKPLNGEWKVD